MAKPDCANSPRGNLCNLGKGRGDRVHPMLGAASITAKGQDGSEAGRRAATWHKAGGVQSI